MVAVVLLVAAAPLIAQQLRWEPRHIDELRPGCDDPKDGCAHAEFTYIEIVSGPAAARARMTAAINASLVNRPSDNLVLTPAQYAKHFIRPGDEATRLKLFKTLRVLRSTPPFFTIEYSEWSYFGSTHGNPAKLYLNFNAQTGEDVKLADILKPDALQRLTAIAEPIFRHETKDKQFFPDFHFALNQNYGFGETSLLFTWMVYDIAPYSEGPTSIEIPYSAIRDLLKPGIML